MSYLLIYFLSVSYLLIYFLSVSYLLVYFLSVEAAQCSCGTESPFPSHSCPVSGDSAERGGGTQGEDPDTAVDHHFPLQGADTIMQYIQTHITLCTSTYMRKCGHLYVCTCILPTYVHMHHTCTPIQLVTL